MTILFTGGGTAGHVVPNIAIIEKLLEQKNPVSYMGTQDGVERSLIAPFNIPYYPIASGKLRRYLSVKNLADPFKVLLGIFQAWRTLGKVKPKLVFSKGGFVAFPAVFAAWLRGIPVIAHESDFTPGLANRMSFPFVKKIAVTFPRRSSPLYKGERRGDFIDNPKIIVTGTPLRDNLFQGDAQKGRELCGFKNDKPCLMVIGGSAGAAAINAAVRQALPALLETINVIHCCGKGKVLDENKEGYKQFEYVNEELPHLYACADMIISRAGANTVYEILALQKPALFIPLSLKASRGDQIENAQFLVSQGLCCVLDESNLNVDTLLTEINNVLNQRAIFQEKMRAYNEEYKITQGAQTIIHLIQQFI